MKLLQPEKDYVINPLESKEIEYWTRKWGITANDLNRAIWETGSIHTSRLKAHLKAQRSMFVALLRWAAYLFGKLKLNS